jgi:hypothetical protein
MRKERKLVLVLAMMFFSQNFYSQSLEVNSSTGSNASYALQDVRRITIENTNLVVLMYNGSSFSYNLATLSNYVYNNSDIQNILNLANDWNVRVFPNPTESTFFIEYFLQNPENISYSIIDQSGKELKKINFGTQLPGQYKTNISVDDLPSGSYIFQIQRDGYSYRNKITKI